MDRAGAKIHVRPYRRTFEEYEYGPSGAGRDVTGVVTDLLRSLWLTRGGERFVYAFGLLPNPFPLAWERE